MSEFKGRHFRGEIVLWAVHWYCRYAASYRDLEAMMTERGVAVDYPTIHRWVQRFAPDMEKRLRWQWRRPQSASWRIDETHVKVRGQWAYLYRALALGGAGRADGDGDGTAVRHATAGRTAEGRSGGYASAWRMQRVIAA